MSQSGSITELIGRLKAGDSAAVEPLWERYFPRLVRLARKTLSGRPRRVADEEDAALSAFTTLWRHASQGEFPLLTDRDSLWSLLAVITIRKARRQIRSEAAAKRGGGAIVLDRPTGIAQSEEFEPDLLTQAISQTPTADLDLQCEELLELLGDTELKAIALFRLMGYTNREIADELECSLRRIERKVRVIRTLWSEELDG